MKITYRILGLAALVSASLLPPAFAGKLKVQTGKGADFAHYKTYQWFPPRMLTKTGIDENNPANPILKEVVNRQMAGKGMAEVAAGGDIQIQAYVFAEYIPQLERVLMGEGYNFDYGTVVATMGRYNREGTLFLNLIDSKTKKSAWSGMFSDSLKRGYLSPEEIRSKLDKAATELFKKYPLNK